MPVPSTRRLALYALVVVAVVVLGGRALRASRDAGAPALPAVGVASPGGVAAPGAAAAPASGDGVQVARVAGGAVLVHVAGAVRRPGVYRLHEGDRVRDAVARAGGGARGADVDAINLAAKVADGQRIAVPRRLGTATAVGGGGGAAGGATAGATGGAAGAGGAGEAGSLATGGAEAPPVDLNTATLEQLDTLDGVGPAIAAKILAWREEHGGFRSVEDLGEIPGIGPKRLEALRARVAV